MGKPKNLSWTAKQIEVRDFLRQGLSPQEVVAKGYSNTMVGRVNKELKKLGIEPGKPPKETPSSTSGESHIRPRTLESVGVGEILIEPADWRINQYGGLLILGTYEHAKKIFNYAGSVGDFLCDVTQIFRMMMGLDMVATDYLVHKEDDNGRREQAGGGAGVPAEVREGAAGPEPEPQPGEA